ncbi:UDP-2,3-diacylglucosamine diphosphatase [Rhodoblastus acidophilus]|uniref:UDP-2,3-diacylglucosamine diphosphatase n=1 Tax=Candidatus Rhodoblastus alkanivorans TaxID=2954117 RepID=A0ABS9Z6L8_9HYPH|nr:UDP-2,3-diacylglucosamine diphosphatase [Candidatus Rhodoblastus alkanivorans]MCI4679569.1 UDP-2,3-diacylglucosamine diphosphatase [Candidatus Rhodoblastus alkanivorans]MCI4683320.1 UDP-2,3-diacylglucosamine diphosphatase [Candidatus Rhodoblastus alkanivorans]MDI4640633.1 UDP-2,3-diacylglucosamine diphosphatase [Rhodoblastus acidophilus]
MNAQSDFTKSDVNVETHTTQKYRTLFISDVHLGTRGCQAELLLDFLKYNESEELFLVGDIIDGWRLKTAWYWPQAHNDVVQKLLRKVRKGARVVFVPGNHDEFARDFIGMEFGGVEVLDHVVHETADGRKMLVVHGDQFDIVVNHARWLAHLGDWAYDFAIWTNTWFNLARRKMGLPYWSFSKWAKLKVKNAVNFIGDFEDTLAAEARKRSVDGVICGHIHHAVIRDIDGITYVNTGDFVESCTAIAEHFDGRLELIHWSLLENERIVAPIVTLNLPGPMTLPEPEPAIAERAVAQG